MAMTVGQLMEELKRFDPDATVEVESTGGEYGPATPTEVGIDESDESKPVVISCGTA